MPARELTHNMAGTSGLGGPAGRFGRGAVIVLVDRRLAGTVTVLVFSPVASKEVLEVAESDYGVPRRVSRIVNHLRRQPTDRRVEGIIFNVQGVTGGVVFVIDADLVEAVGLQPGPDISDCLSLHLGVQFAALTHSLVQGGLGSLQLRHRGRGARIAIPGIPRAALRASRFTTSSAHPVVSF